MGKDKEPHYKFLHLAIQEYLAAAWIKRQLEESDWNWNTNQKLPGNMTANIHRLIDKKSWDPRWAQVVIFFAGMLEREEDQVHLLKMLSDKKTDDIFRHRLMLAADCMAEMFPNGIDHPNTPE